MSGLGLIGTGNGPGVGPIVPLPLPSLGIAGYSHRYCGARLPSVDGQAVPSWLDSGSSPAAMGITNGSSSVAKTDLAFQYLRTTATVLGNSVPEAPTVSFAALFRSASLSLTELICGGVLLKRAGTGSFQVAAAGTGGSGSLTSSYSSSAWTCAVITVTPTTTSYRIGTSSGSNAITPGTPVATALGINSAGAVFDIADLAVWSGLNCTDTDRLTIYNAVKAAYPSASLA